MRNDETNVVTSSKELMVMALEKEYFAFISYQRKDEEWADRLRSKLEHYRLPSNVRKQDASLPKEIRPIFRDALELAGGVLAKEIETALQQSKFLIVICSPNSAKSPWVNKEIQTFIDLGREDRIIPFIIDGTPFSDNEETECFPPALRSLKGEKELLGININELSRDAASIKVVARMFGLKFDTLWQRHEKEKRRKSVIWGTVLALFVCFGFGGYSYVMNKKHEADIAQQDKIIQKLYTDYFQCEKLYNEQKYLDAFNECRKILKGHVAIPDTLSSKYEYLLRMSYAAIQADTLEITNKYSADFPAMDWGEMPVLFSDNGDTVFIGCSGFSIIDALTGKCINRAVFWPSDIRVIGDRIYTFDDFNISIYDRNTLNQKVCHKLTTSADNYQMKVGSSADGKRLLTNDSNNGTYNVFDYYSGTLVNSFPSSSSSKASINYNGSIIAINENEKLRLYQVDSKEQINEYNDLYASDLQFDQSGKWLLLYLGEYDALNIINIDTKENYYIDSLNNQWHNSFNFDGSSYANKYIVSDDNRYIAIGANIYDMADGSLYKRLNKSEEAMGLKIYADARKVIQVNVDKEIMVYTRSGEPMFKTKNIDFTDVINNDKTSKKYDIETDDYGTIYIKNKGGDLIGKISDVDGEIYHLSISPDEKYILVNSLAIPSSLYDLTTGTVVQQFPFRPGYDGDLGYGVIGEDGNIYFNGLNTVFQYHLIPIDQLIDMDVKQQVSE